MTRKNDLHDILRGKWEDGTRPKDLYAQRIAKHPASHVESIVLGLRAGNRRVENGCAELASLISAQTPELLYPHLARFVDNLASKEAVLRWEAACTIGNLAAVDSEGAIPAQIPSLTRFLSDKSIVLQGHSIRALVKIARVNPKRASAILTAILDAREHFPGNRVGHVIEAMESFAGDSRFARKVREAVAPHVESEIKSVAAKARKVVKKLAAKPT